MKLCTCYSHQFVPCRGKEGLGIGWICEKELREFMALNMDNVTEKGPEATENK